MTLSPRQGPSRRGHRRGPDSELATLTLAGPWRFVERRVEEGAGRAGGQAEWAFPPSVGSVTAQWSGKIGMSCHGPSTPMVEMTRGGLFPIGTEVILAIRMGKAIEEVRGFEIRLHVKPVFVVETRQSRGASNPSTCRRSVRAGER